MAIDLSENGRGYYDLKEHIGHKIVCVGYKAKPNSPPLNVTLECETCGMILVDFDNPSL